MPIELFHLLTVIGLSLVVALVIVMTILLWRVIKKKPILPEQSSKKETPQVLVLGLFLFGLFALVCFLSGMPNLVWCLYCFQSHTCGDIFTTREDLDDSKWMAVEIFFIL